MSDESESPEAKVNAPTTGAREAHVALIAAYAQQAEGYAHHAAVAAVQAEVDAPLWYMAGRVVTLTSKVRFSTAVMAVTGVHVTSRNQFEPPVCCFFALLS